MKVFVGVGAKTWTHLMMTVKREKLKEQKSV